MEAINPLDRAIEIIGNPNRLATAIGRRQSTVWGWVKRGWPAPNACLEIERATGGKVKATDLLKPALKSRQAA